MSDPLNITRAIKEMIDDHAHLRFAKRRLSMAKDFEAAIVIRDKIEVVEKKMAAQLRMDNPDRIDPADRIFPAGASDPFSEVGKQIDELLNSAFKQVEEKLNRDAKFKARS